MDEERITLDRGAFRALASDSRIALLKALDARRKTPSELSRELGLSVQSVSEHLLRLEEAELARRVESGRKWVYYELTTKGRGVLHPEASRARVWVVLGLTLLAVSGFLFLNSLQPGGFGASFASKAAERSQGGVLGTPAAVWATPGSVPLATPQGLSPLAAEGDAYRAMATPLPTMAPLAVAAGGTPVPLPSPTARNASNATQPTATPSPLPFTG